MNPSKALIDRLARNLRRRSASFDEECFRRILGEAPKHLKSDTNISRAYTSMVGEAIIGGYLTLQDLERNPPRRSWLCALLLDDIPSEPANSWQRGSLENLVQTWNLAEALRNHPWVDAFIAHEHERVDIQHPQSTLRNQLLRIFPPEKRALRHSSEGIPPPLQVNLRLTADAFLPGKIYPLSTNAVVIQDRLSEQRLGIILPPDAEDVIVVGPASYPPPNSSPIPRKKTKDSQDIFDEVQSHFWRIHTRVDSQWVFIHCFEEEKAAKESFLSRTKNALYGRRGQT